MTAVTITVGDVPAECEFGDSPTARRILEVLPIQAKGSYWGGEFYFPIPVKEPLERDAREVVEPGTVAYWPQGACLCVFWGPTPASVGPECRAASAVNLVGRVLNLAVLPRWKARGVQVAAKP